MIFLCVLTACSGSALDGATKDVTPAVDLGKYRLKVDKAREYCAKQGLNKRFFFLLDLGRHSGLNRFFVWDFEKDTIVHAFLVSHGCGSYPWTTTFTKESTDFSNEEGSHKSSIGKYAIGERGPSQWGIGIKYLLHGMDATNSNALKRAIVLHSWDQVSSEEVYPDGTPEGWGCPAVSNESMRIIDNLLKGAGSRTLLWVVE